MLEHSASRGPRPLPIILESSPLRSYVLSGGITAAGLLFMSLTRDFQGYGSNEFAAFLLGVLLFSLGVGNLVLFNQRTVTIDPAEKQIVVRDRWRFGTKVQVINFEEIERTRIQKIGTSGDGTPSYDVVLVLTSGNEFALFSAAFFEGAFDRSEMERHRMRIENLLEDYRRVSKLRVENDREEEASEHTNAPHSADQHQHR